jgi:diguanylate cyclase (GGDEF)-like protein
MGERIREAVRSHDFAKAMQREIRLSASLGVSVYPDHGGSVAELIQKADRAMYCVKNSGKNAVQLAK